MVRLVIVSRNGHARVISGWRAWLVATAGMIIAWTLMLAVASLVIGLSLTIGLILLLALPALAGVALVAQRFGRGG